MGRDETADSHQEPRAEAGAGCGRSANVRGAGGGGQQRDGDGGRRSRQDALLRHGVARGRPRTQRQQRKHLRSQHPESGNSVRYFDVFSGHIACTVLRCCLLHVAWSVCVCVSVSELTKTAEPIEMPSRGLTLVGPKN